MKEVTVRSWCDVCWSTSKQRTASVWTIDYDVRYTEYDPSKRASSTVDLCEEHEKEVVRLLRAGRVISDNKPRKLEEPVRKTARGTVTTGKAIIPCPVCGKDFIRGPGLTLHCKARHPELDREELRRYTRKIVEDHEDKEWKESQ